MRVCKTNEVMQIVDCTHKLYVRRIIQNMSDNTPETLTEEGEEDTHIIVTVVVGISRDTRQGPGEDRWVGLTAREILAL